LASMKLCDIGVHSFRLRDSGIYSFNTYIDEGVDDLSEGEEWSCARGRTVGVRPQQGGVQFKCK